jgi:hypothetical protein
MLTPKHPGYYFCLAVTTQSDYAAYNKTRQEAEGGGQMKKKSKKWYSFLGLSKKEEKPEHGLSVLFPAVSWLSQARQSVSFMASYYHDGDIHANGNHAPFKYTCYLFRVDAPHDMRTHANLSAKDTETAQFTKGDIITVQVGLRDLKTATSSASGWAEYVPLYPQIGCLA